MTYANVIRGEKTTTSTTTSTQTGKMPSSQTVSILSNPVISPSHFQQKVAFKPFDTSSVALEDLKTMLNAIDFTNGKKYLEDGEMRKKPFFEKGLYMLLKRVSLQVPSTGSREAILGRHTPFHIKN